MLFSKSREASFTLHKENTKEIDIFTSYFIIDRIGIFDSRL